MTKICSYLEKNNYMYNYFINNIYIFFKWLDKKIYKLYNYIMNLLKLKYKKKKIIINKFYFFYLL